MADETKTKEQLIAEIESLKRELELPTSGTGKTDSAQDVAAAVLRPSTRRGLLSWIAPVILSLGTVAKVGTAQAASTDDFTEPPPRTGPCIPQSAAAPMPMSADQPATASADEPATTPTPAPTLTPTPTPTRKS